MLDVVDAINSFIEAHAATPWALGVVFLLIVIDSAFPPLPSESAVIALGAFGASTGKPVLVVLGAVAASAAWLGDNAVYTLATHSPLRRLRGTGRHWLGRSFDLAARELDRRGGLLIVVARFIPVGRVAVNVTAGASAFPRRRFVVLTAVGALAWSTYSVGIGALAGRWVDQNPLLGAGIGIAAAVLLGLAGDHLIGRLRGTENGVPAQG